MNTFPSTTEHALQAGDKVVAFDNPNAYARSIRATVFGCRFTPTASPA